jgi:hypothetical protein
MEKILEVGEQRSIVKIFFVMEGVQKACIAIAIMDLFFLKPNFYKIKIPMVSTKSSTWAWGTKTISRKTTKIFKTNAKMMQFHKKFGGQPKEGVVHGPNPSPPRPSLPPPDPKVP